MIYKVNNILEINLKVRGYCKFPYYGHKNGCPNFNESELCPPKIKTVDNYFDINKDLFFIITEFNLKSHIENMKIKHPKWSPYQLKNLLYWQNGVRKTLKEKVKNFIQHHKEWNKLTYTLLPEAMGIDVFTTLHKLSVPIERNPTNKIFKVALVGYSKNDKYLASMNLDFCAYSKQNNTIFDY